MLTKSLASAVAAITATMLAVTAADAAKKNRYQYGYDTGYQYRTQAPYRSDPTSLDGRVMGFPRTCGFDRLKTDSTLTPIGPYCH